MEKKILYKGLYDGSIARLSSLIFIFFVCVLTSISCRKPKYTISEGDTNMPPITSEGKGTIGCYVNGQPWVLLGFNTDVQCYYYPWHDAPKFYGTLAITASRDKDNSGLNMTLHNRVFSAGKHYLFTSTSIDDILYYQEQSISFSYLHYIDTNNFVNITRLDTINRIASGVFHFKVINENDKFDTVKVTDGRFDLKF